MSFLEQAPAAETTVFACYAEAVFNYKLGGDTTETVCAVRVDRDDRGQVSHEVETIEARTHFSFPGRASAYSSMEWHWHHFQAVDHEDEGGSQIYLLKGKEFDPNVDGKKGNCDFLLGCDVELDHPEVRAELVHWCEWLVKTAVLDGFRFDAMKHIKPTFFRDRMTEVTERTGRPLFSVGEYWSCDVDVLSAFLEAPECRLSLFDALRHYDCHTASNARNG